MRDKSKSTWIPGAVKLTAAARATIIELWTSKRATQTQLARMYGVAQSLIHEVVKRSGSTRKNQPAEQHQCDQCGKAVSVNRPQRNNRRHFCSRACFYAKLHNPSYQRSVYGTKLARRKVSEHFKLSEFNVVHHVDFDNNNNEISNLWVFKDSGDHTSFHRGGNVQPIWKGSSVG